MCDSTKNTVEHKWLQTSWFMDAHKQELQTSNVGVVLTEERPLECRGNRRETPDLQTRRDCTHMTHAMTICEHISSKQQFYHITFITLPTFPTKSYPAICSPLHLSMPTPYTATRVDPSHLRHRKHINSDRCQFDSLK